MASLLWRIDNDRLHLDNRTVVILDEAGMADDPSVLRLLSAAEHAGSKVVLVGDHRQLGAVGPGGTLICGVTSYLDVYGRPGSPATTAPGAAGSTPGSTPGHYVVQARLTIDAKHALGIDANLADLSQLQSVRDFVNSVSFTSPQCQG